MLRQLGKFGVVMTLLCVSPMLASAQDDQYTREPTEAQLEMNSKAIEAINQKDYAKAIKLFQASIALGELNITYLNMARTYHRMGECSKAKRIYRLTRDVRYKVAEPTPDQINEALNKYESQLYKDCTNGELTVICEPGKMDLYLNGSGPIACPSSDDPLRLKEGEYIIRGEMEGYETSEIKVNVARVDPTTVALTLAKQAPKEVVTNTPPKETVIIKSNENDAALEEVRQRLRDQEKEKQAKAERARLAEQERQRQLDEQRVLRRALREKEIELERRNTRLRRISWGVASSFVVAGAIWDSCIFGGGWNGHLYNQYGTSVCAHTYNDQFEGKDLIPVGFYFAGVSTLIISKIVQNVRRKNFELDYKALPEPSNFDDL